MKVSAIRFAADNYAYWVQRLGGTLGFFIDTGSYPEIHSFLKSNNLPAPMHIFSTHKHLDHCGGNMKLKGINTKIYAGELDANSVLGCTNPLKNNQRLEIDGMEINVINTPCHTTGHVMYQVKVNSNPNEKIRKIEKNINSNGHWIEYSEGINRALFTGDTIFVGGCGRFFEGNAEDMVKIMDKLLLMPEDLYLFCGHEYSFDNARFGLLVEPENTYMKGFYNKAELAKNKDDFMIPSTLKKEKMHNVFMRYRTKEIQRILNSNDPVKCMNILRNAKNKGKFP